MTWVGEARSEATRKIDAAVTDPDIPHAGGVEELVPLDPDHPGFKDPVYRARRNAIARLALEYRDGDPLPHAEYTEEEQTVWRTVWEHLAPLHEKAACREWKESSAALALDRERVPQLAEVNEALKRGAGFRMLPVAGLVSGRMFLGMMGKGVFLSTQYMRHHSVPLYTPEPDVVHELVGHAASLFHPSIVKLSRRFGEAAWRVDDAALKRLEYLYWYTLEFGLVEEGGVRKAYGAGLLSSFGELGDFEAHAELRPLDCDEAASIPYDPTQYQKVLFVSPSFERMVEDVSAWLEHL
ncbi:MAG TPA: phenylalanine 4-monooxygenase [Thermoanaerobaculia bacterium]|nr:phenylalanine 4-monooxygenase [Thermoanaerobaculia bacterium]